MNRIKLHFMSLKCNVFFEKWKLPTAPRLFEAPLFATILPKHHLGRLFRPPFYLAVESKLDGGYCDTLDGGYYDKLDVGYYDKLDWGYCDKLDGVTLI